MNDDYIASLTPEKLLDDETFLRIFDHENKLDRERYLARVKQKASKFGQVKIFDQLYKSWMADYIQKTKNQESNVMDFTGCPLPGLHCGRWNATDLGVTRQELVNGCEAKTVVARPHPILPVERLTNLDTETEKIKLAFFKDGTWQTVTVDRSVCANKTRIIDLADRGVEVTSENARDLVQYISDVVSLRYGVRSLLYQAISRCGWVGENFAPYCKEIRYDGRYQNYKQVYDGIRAQGDFDEWVKKCHELRQNIYLRMQNGGFVCRAVGGKIRSATFCPARLGRDWNRKNRWLNGGYVYLGKSGVGTAGENH